MAILRITGKLVACTLLALSCGQVLAQSTDDCLSSRDPKARLSACSALINDQKSSPGDRALAYRNRGTMRLEAGALDQAIADLTEALKISPRDERALVLRAQARLSRNTIEAAIADYNAALAINPNSTAALNGRGHAELVRGNATAAIEDFTKAITQSPISAVAYNNRGLAHRRAGNLELALADFSTAITLNPVYALAYNNRGYARETQGQRELAIADLRRALVIDPSLAGAKEGLRRLGVMGTPETDRLVREGEALVETHCSRCHAVGLSGGSPNSRAPEFRSLHGRHPILALREPLTRGIVAPHDEMPYFALQETDVEKIVSYINSLSPKQ